MNKNILTLIVVVGIIGLLLFVLTSSNNSNESTSEVVEIVERDSGTGSTQNGQPNNQEMMAQEKVTAPEGAIMYSVDSVTVSYKVLKDFVEKTDQAVMGTTNNVDVTAWADFDNQDFYLKADIKLNGLKSDNATRDGDVLKLFNPTIASVMLDSNSLGTEIMSGENFSTTAILDLTINGITNPVEFDINGNVDEETINAEGSAEIMMSDFGITPPDMPGVYTVSDETELMFEINGAAK